MGAGFLAWIDLETTGTDEKFDDILELGLIVTDENLTALDAASFVVQPYEPRWLTRLRTNEVVRQMHRANGLVMDVIFDPWGSAAAVEEAAIQMLEKVGKKHDFLLAGSGVAHFDRRFLKAQMPTLESWFRYPVLDVGVIRRGLQLAGRDDLVPPQPEKNHRALDDIRAHLEEMRHYQQLFQQIGRQDDGDTDDGDTDGAINGGRLPGVGALGADGASPAGGAAHRGSAGGGKLPADRRS